MRLFQSMSNDIVSWFNSSLLNDQRLWIATSIALVPIPLALAYHTYLSYSFPGEAPVHWTWNLLIGNAKEIGVRPIQMLQEKAKQYGDIFGMVVGGQRMFIISDCKSTNTILKPSKDLSWEEFHDSILIYFFNVRPETVQNHVVDNNLMRKWWSQYLLTDKYLHELSQRMLTQLNKNISEVQPGQYLLYDFLSRFIFKASMAALFNEDAGQDNQLYQAFMNFDKEMPYAAAGISMDYFPQAAAGREVLTQACAKYIQGTAELMTKRWEYFQSFVKAGQLKSSEPPKQQLAMLWASVGNTMPATFWMVYYLMNSPEFFSKIQEETRICVEKFNKGIIDQEDLNQMVFVDACITEGLRLSSGSLIMRVVRNPCELTLASGQTYKFRRGDRVGLCPPLFHLDPEIFPDPTQFNPTRWLRGETFEERSLAANGKIPLFKNGEELQSASVFLPFGAGVTLCPGRRFARNEVKILLVFLLSRLNFEFVDSNPIIPSVNGSRAGIGIFPPKEDVPVLVSLKQ